MEKVHVKFDKLTTMASKCNNLEPEYYEKRNPEMSTNSTAPNTLNNEDTPSSSTIILNDNDALQIVSTSDEPTSPITNDLADELI
ncbi:hypothetical protein Tco_1549448 [Tanacetum coccineum]